MTHEQRYDADDPREWLRRAGQDLLFARATVPGVPDFELHCYHAQQAAEKALKAICIARSLVFPFTHRIERLLDLLAEDGVDVPQTVRAATILSRYATAGRYPAQHAIDAETHDAAVMSAAAVVEWAAIRIAEGPPGVREQPAPRYDSQPRGSRLPEPQLLADIVARIVPVAAPECIILFGSGARGTMRPGSDLDLLIVTQKDDRSGECEAAIRRSIAQLHIDVDIVMATADQLARYGRSIGLVYRPALEEGRVIYGAKPAC